MFLLNSDFSCSPFSVEDTFTGHMLVVIPELVTFQKRPSSLMESGTSYTEHCKSMANLHEMSLAAFLKNASALKCCNKKTSHESNKETLSTCF